jgi:hypothetical protein
MESLGTKGTNMTHDTEQPWGTTELLELCSKYRSLEKFSNELRRLRTLVQDLESEAQTNARIIGASAETELALRAQIQELQRRNAKLENELSARDAGSTGSTNNQKPVAWMHVDTFWNLQNTAKSGKHRWLVYNLSEHYNTDEMIPLYSAPHRREPSVRR